MLRHGAASSLNYYLCLQGWVLTCFTLVLIREIQMNDFLAKLSARSEPKLFALSMQ